MNEIDQKYTELMQEKEELRQWMYSVFSMDPKVRKEFLTQHGMSEADFAAQGMLQAQQVEGGEPAGGSLNKEKEAQKTGIGVEPVSMFEDPAAIAAVLIQGVLPIAGLINAVLFGKVMSEDVARLGAGPVLQGIAEFIGNLSNPAGEEKILAQYGPEVLAEAKSAMGAEANVTILEKLKAGIESGEIKPGKIPINLLSKFKGILKAPKDEALRALKAGFVSPETESQLFAAQSRRINRINHMLEVMKNSTPEEIQAIMPSLADEFIKYQELATSKITTIDKSGKTITRLSKVEYTPEQLKEIGQFAERTDFAGILARLFKDEQGGTKFFGGLNEPKLTLIKTEEDGLERFVISDYKGNSIGKISIEPGVNAKVDFMEVPEDELGTFGVRSLLRQYQEMHPETTSISGTRYGRGLVTQSLIKGEEGSSQLISNISSRLYMFGKSIIYGDKGQSIPQRLAQAEINAQMMDPRITERKLITDVFFIPYQRLVQSIALGFRYKSFTAGERAFFSAMSAYFKSFPEAMSIMKQTMKTGDPEFEKLLQEGLTKGELKDLGFQNAHYGMDSFDLTDPGMAHNYTGVMATGSRWVLGADQFAKVAAHRSGMRMLALEHNLEELGAKGLKGPKLLALAEQQTEKDMAEIPDWLIRSSNADRYRSTFTDSGKWISEMSSFMNRHPWAKVYFEFVRTPMNLEKESLRHTPLGLFPGAVFGDTGLEATATQAKAVVGSLFCAWVYNETLKGNITGSGPTAPAHFNMNLAPPYTMYGHSYQHVKPIGTLMAMCADAAESMANIKDPEDRQKVTGAIVKAAAETLLNVPTMDGMVNLVQAADEASKGRAYGLENILGQKVAAFVPGPVKMAADIIDPEQRQKRTQTQFQIPEIPKESELPYGVRMGTNIFIDQAQNILDSVINKTPLRNGIPYRKWDAEPQWLPPGVDAEGTPPDPMSVILNMFNPAPIMPDNRDDLDKELEKRGIYFNRAPKALNVNGQMIPLSNEQQDRYTVLAGKELKNDEGMTQRERGNDLLTKDLFINAPDEEARNELLKSNHYMYTGMAEQVIRQELQAPTTFTEDFPTKPLDKGPSTPPSLGE